MTVSIIKHDSKIIGIADHDAAGIGVLQWFHSNCRAYSMDHATTHEGYSVEEVEEVDCYDVESLIGAICERAGVTMEATFVPFSQSRHAKGGGADGKPWRSLNWRVMIKRHGHPIIQTDYAQGEGHAPASKKTPAQMETAARAIGRPARIAQKIMLDHEIETGRVATGHSWSHGVSGGKPIPAPSIGDVLQSLASDADVLDSAGFEDWARNLGYDADSRAAEAIYRACVEIATKMRTGLGVQLLAEIRLAASFN